MTKQKSFKMPNNFDHKIAILEVESFDKRLNLDETPSYFHRHGILHHLSRISLHQSTNVCYKSIPKRCHAKSCRNHDNEPLHAMTYETKQQPRGKSHSHSGSKIYHKILRWKNSLKKFRLSKKAAISSNSARNNNPSVSKRRFSLCLQSKCADEKAKMHLLEKSSFVPAHDNIPCSLTNILRCKESVKHFREFLTIERSEENLDFWFDVEHFKNNPRMEEAARIAATYVGEEASKEVNLSYRVKKQINEDSRNELSLQHIFDVAQVEIFQLMQKDSFVRFKANLTEQNRQPYSIARRNF